MSNQRLKQIKLESASPSYENFCETSQNVHLTTSKNGTVLCANLIKQNGQTNPNQKLKLDQYISNQEGNLAWGGKNFSESAKNIQLEFPSEKGANLTALCRTMNGGYKESSLDLNRFIGNDDGRFAPKVLDSTNLKNEIKEPHSSPLTCASQPTSNSASPPPSSLKAPLPHFSTNTSPHRFLPPPSSNQVAPSLPNYHLQYVSREQTLKKCFTVILVGCIASGKSSFINSLGGTIAGWKRPFVVTGGNKGDTGGRGTEIMTEHIFLPSHIRIIDSPGNNQLLEVDYSKEHSKSLECWLKNYILGRKLGVKLPYPNKESAKTSKEFFEPNNRARLVTFLFSASELLTDSFFGFFRTPNLDKLKAIQKIIKFIGNEFQNDHDDFKTWVFDPVLVITHVDQVSENERRALQNEIHNNVSTHTFFISNWINASEDIKTESKEAINSYCSYLQNLRDSGLDPNRKVYSPKQPALPPKKPNE